MNRTITDNFSYSTKFIFGLLIFAISFSGLKGQTYPITANTVIIPPVSRYLTDYTNPGSQKLMLNLVFNDFTVPSYQVALNVKINGPGVSLTTAPNFIGRPITLMPGMNSLTGADVSDYLSPSNMEVTGGNPTAFRQSGTFEDGMYTICFQATDIKRRDVKLSNESCVPISIRRNEPPLATLPNCGATVPSVNGSQNIMFTWQRRHDPSIQAEYLFTMVEVPTGINPNQALISTQTPLLKDFMIQNMTSFNYDPSQPNLTSGKTYAYRVDVRDPLGQTTFENNGIGQVCHFTYGFKGGGDIPLVSPADDAVLQARNAPTFEWKGPTNAVPGLKLVYKLSVYEINKGQSKENATKQNSRWYNYESTIVTQFSNWNHAGTKKLPTDKEFAWKVEAFARDNQNGTDQLIATSKVRKFIASPVVSNFYAASGRVKVMVKSATSSTVSPGKFRMTGKGQIELLPGKPPVDIDFSNVVVEERTTTNVMREGTIRSKIVETDIPVTWKAPNQKNGDIKFVTDEVVITTTNQKIVGQTNWTYPHATMKGKGVVKSKRKEIAFDNAQIQDFTMFEETNFELVDPMGFKVNMNATSKFTIYNNEAVAEMNGYVATPSKVKDLAGNRLQYVFEKIDQPFYYENKKLPDTPGIRMVKNAEHGIKANHAYFDFSTEKSPGKKDADKTWKGLYFEKFTVNFPTNFDKGKQLVMNKEENIQFTVDAASDDYGWIETQGFDLKAIQSWNGNGPKATFNSFPDNIEMLSFQIEDNLIDNSFISGFIKIPILAHDEHFNYKIPVKEFGLEVSQVSGIVGRSMTLNKYDDIRECTFVIHNAVFKNNERLEMSIDLEWPALGFEMKNINNFCIWGDGDAGFGSKDGNIAVPSQTPAWLPGKKTWPFVISRLYAGEESGYLSFFVKGPLNIAENFTGDKGSKTPEIAIGSTYAYLPNAAPPEIEKQVGDMNVFGAGVKHIDSPDMFMAAFRTNLHIIDVSGTIIYKINDPVWGDSFYAGLEGSLKIPALLDLKAFLQLIVGKKEKANGNGKFTYWFFEVGIDALDRKVNATGNFGRVDAKGFRNGIGKPSFNSDEVAYIEAAVVSTEKEYEALVKAFEKAAQAKDEATFNRLKPELERKRKIFDARVAALEKKKNEVKEPEAQTSLQKTLEVALAVKKFANAIGDYKKFKLETADYKAQKGWAPFDTGSEKPPKDKGVRASAKQKFASAKSSAKNLGAKIKTKVVAKQKRIKAYSGGPSKTAGIGQKFSGAKSSYSKTANKLHSKLQGIPIPPLHIKLIGLQGRIYWRMSHDIEDGILKSKVAGAAAAAKAANQQQNATASVFDQFSLPEYPQDKLTFDYTPDENVSFGMMLMARINDLETGGNIAELFGAIEVVFTSGGGLSDIAVEAEGKFGNLSVPFLDGEPLAKVYSKLHISPRNKKITFDLIGRSSKQLCFLFDAHGEISSERMHFKLGEKARPCVAVFGPCQGPKVKGFFELKDEYATNQAFLELGGGVGLFAGWRAKLDLPSDNFVEASAGIDVEIGNFATKLRLKPKPVKLQYFEAGFSANVSVNIKWDLPKGPWQCCIQEKGSKGVSLGISGNIGAYAEGDSYWVKGDAGVCVDVSGQNKCLKAPFATKL